MWDVFISHASEDKEEVAAPLARLLRKKIRVWIDAGEIRPGDSIRERIDEGLSESRFGVVILSKKFFSKKKKWTKRELDALLEREADGRVVIPVLHLVDHAFVERVAPSLSGKAALDTGRGLPALAKAIVERITSRTVYRHQGEYADRLTRMVSSGASRPTALYVSIGTGDFVSQWLVRAAHQLPGAKISKVILLALPTEEARRREVEGLLAKGFASKMNENIATISSEAGVPVECREWTREPEFHGIMHGAVALIGEWGQDEKGRRHVHTPLVEISKGREPERFRALLAAFKNAPPHS